MFEQLKKLWGRKPSKDAQSGQGALPPIDLAQLQAAAEADPEMQELDALYRQALAAMENVEVGCDSVTQAWSPEESDFETQEPESDAENSPSPTNRVDDAHLAESESAGPDVTPHQILEAALFVGGTDLTLKKLVMLLNDEFPPESIERFLEELEQQYANENRPYEIAYGEGGFRLALRSEFDGVRDRVFGLGPREIKLSQDALEVLSLVAYRQPISGDDVKSLRGTQASSILRQLVRRELITLDRPDEADRNHVVYQTSSRFLQAFGIAGLEDLPQADDLLFK